jgi:hypothetical protein
MDLAVKVWSFRIPVVYPKVYNVDIILHKD